MEWKSERHGETTWCGPSNKKKNDEKKFDIAWRDLIGRHKKSKKVLNRYKEKYFEKFNDFDKAMIQYTTVKGKLKNIEEKKRLDHKIYDLYSDFKASEKDYKKNYYDAKKSKVSITKETGKIISEVQKLSQSQYIILKESLINLFDKQIERYNILKEDSNKTKEVVMDDKEAFESNKFEFNDIEEIKFINVPEKYSTFIKKLEPLYLNNKSYENIDIEKLISENANPDMDEGQGKYFKETLVALWTTGKVSEDKMKDFYQHVKTKDDRSQFCEVFNIYRSKGAFSIPRVGYNPIVNLIKLVLDESDNGDDIDSASRILILSQTYFTEVINENGEHKKVYIQQKIQQHPIWKKKEFWRKTIVSGIEEEKKILITTESKEDQELMFKSSIFGKLGAIAHNMIGMGMELDVVKEVILEHAKSANLLKEQITILEVMFKYPFRKQ